MGKELSSTQTEVKVTPAWIRLVRYCHSTMPHGDLKVKIVNGEPTKLLETKPDYRFDKPGMLPNELPRDLTKD